MQKSDSGTTAVETPTGLNPWGFPSARIISLVSQKGGVGKTTSTVNLGSTFALSGQRTLLIGLDPQCGLSLSLGFDGTTPHGGLRDTLIAGLPLDDVIHDTSLDKLHLLSPNARTMAQEEQYKTAIGKYGVLDDLLDQIREDYDTILIDCPPGFGPETRAALTVSDSFLIPVQAEELCRNSITRLLDFIRDFGPVAKNGIQLEGLFLTMTDSRIRMSRQVSEELGKEFGAAVFATAVPRAARLAEMALQGRPTVIYDRRSPGSRAYFDLMDEIMVRHSKRPQPAVARRRPARKSGISETRTAVDSGRPLAAASPGNGSAGGTMSRLWRTFIRRREVERRVGDPD